MDLDLRRDTADATQGLMNEIMRIRQGNPPFHRYRKQNDGGGTCHQPHSYYMHLRFDEPEHIEYGKTRIRITSGGVHKNLDGLIPLRFKEYKLPDDPFGELLVDLPGKQNGPGFHHFLDQSILTLFFPFVVLFLFLFLKSGETVYHNHLW